MLNFRPISLCNVLYKIALNALVNRFQEVFQFCIDEAQSAFVLGHLSSDNIVVAYEILHSMKNRRFGKEWSFALKLDMSKAYDSVEWQFIDEILLKMGFLVNWVEWIMWFITLVTYLVVVNRRVLVENSGTIKGARVVGGALRVTHLLFVDDNLIFGDATTMGASNILKKATDKRGIHCCTWSFLSNIKDDRGMGDLAKFNISIGVLAKQGWRILIHLTLLMARILRAKYFPNTRFLSAQLGSKPSLVWRSIWSARKLIEMGLKWNVGIGNIERMSELIFPNGMGWNWDLIDLLFVTADAILIQGIPLLFVPQEDYLMWGGERSSIYSVCSSYRLLLQ
ncbi:hypothetical protein J1N35_013494 [Gossypium stocksii]|uniref:Reverse transcriptase domain-containing protein n=1 Tax=Gossypium stocksii TaxID=47602 RepID=A0A9D4A6S0_9ROSI|nr:hypothetical protein J1N35_013494 [Gossypium stocksii]